MSDIWLRTNARLALLAAIAALAIGAACGLVALGLTPFELNLATRAVAGSLAVVSAAVCWIALWSARRPRLAFERGNLLVYMRPGAPIRLPIEHVECFLMGRAPSFLHRRRDADSETTTVVVRLRPQSEEWSHIEVEPRLGSWCDSHIIIRGTWCEPIRLELLHELNRRLAEAQRSASLHRGSA
jgi:hypothetical protein